MELGFQVMGKTMIKHVKEEPNQIIKKLNVGIT